MNEVKSVTGAAIVLARVTSFVSNVSCATMGVGGKHGAAESCPSADEPIIRSVYGAAVLGAAVLGDDNCE